MGTRRLVPFQSDDKNCIHVILLAKEKVLQFRRNLHLCGNHRAVITIRLHIDVKHE